MEAIINNDVFSKIFRVFEMIDRIGVPEKAYEYPAKYHIIRHIDVNGERCALIFDFEQQIEYVVYPKPKH